MNRLRLLFLTRFLTALTCSTSSLCPLCLLCALCVALVISRREGLFVSGVQAYIAANFRTVVPLRSVVDVPSARSILAPLTADWLIDVRHSQ